MLSKVQTLKIFEDCGALIQNGHFVYTSGKHGKEYVNKDAVYPHTELISALCKSIAETFLEEKIEVVLGPALGGIILSQWTAHHLSALSKQEVLSTYAEKTTDGKFALRRGYDVLISNKRTLIVEDVITTGGSVKKIVELAKKFNADIRGVAALVNRGNVSGNEIGHPKLTSLLQIAFESWNSEDCPLCKSNIPVQKSVGKG